MTDRKDATDPAAGPGAVREIYLDHNASSPLRPEALRAMRPFLAGTVGNPSSVHAAGRRARAALEAARRILGQCVGARPEELVFTSGGTESNNLALFGILNESRTPRGALLVGSVEHPCVLEAARAAAAHGHRVAVIPADSEGRIQPDALRAMLTPDVRLVSVQLANHEVGTVQPIAALASIVHSTSAVLHVDGVQALGRIAVDVRALGADLMSFSAHKVGGPTGIGALYVREGLVLERLHHGGSQELGRRAGTPSAALAQGFAAAVTAAEAERDVVNRRHARWKRHIVAALASAVPNVRVNSPVRDCLANTLNLAFPAADRDALLINLDLAGVRVSAGAACASGSLEPSPVLLAMQLEDARSACAIRISFGSRTTKRDVDDFLRALVPALARASRDARFF